MGRGAEDGAKQAGILNFTMLQTSQYGVRWILKQSAFILKHLPLFQLAG